MGAVVSKRQRRRDERALRKAVLSGDLEAIRDTSATEGEVIGVLQLMNKHDGYFTDEDEAKVRLSMGETLHTSFTRFSGRGEHDLS